MSTLRQGIGGAAGGTVSPDLGINSIGVGCAASGVTGEAKAGKYMPCSDTEPVIAQLPSTSTAVDIWRAIDKTGKIWARIQNTGKFILDFYMSALIYFSKVGYDVYFQVADAGFGFIFRNSSNSEVAKIDAVGQARFNQGVNYPPQTAPAAPTTGATVYTDSVDGNVKCKFANGNIVTIATDVGP